MGVGHHCVDSCFLGSDLALGGLAAMLMEGEQPRFAHSAGLWLR